MFHLLWHMSQWPGLQKSHQIMAIIIAVLALVGAIIIMLKAQKLTVGHKMFVLGTMLVCLLGNGVFYIVNGVQALHSQQTQLAGEALGQVAGTQITHINTSNKTLVDILPFTYGGVSVNCSVTRDWTTTDPHDPSQYQVGDTQVIVDVHYAANMKDVAGLKCVGSIPKPITKQQQAAK